jgi:hypothetical protein
MGYAAQSSESVTKVCSNLGEQCACVCVKTEFDRGSQPNPADGLCLNLGESHFSGRIIKRRGINQSIE